MNAQNVAVLLKPLDAIPKQAKPATLQIQEARRFMSIRLIDEQKCALLQAKKKPE